MLALTKIFQSLLEKDQSRFSKATSDALEKVMPVGMIIVVGSKVDGKEHVYDAYEIVGYENAHKNNEKESYYMKLKLLTAMAIRRNDFVSTHEMLLWNLEQEAYRKNLSPMYTSQKFIRGLLLD